MSYSEIGILLFIAALLLFSAGLLLVFLGAIFKKASQKIPGIILLVTGIISGIAAFIFLVVPVRIAGCDYIAYDSQQDMQYGIESPSNDELQGSGSNQSYESLFSDHSGDITGFIRGSDNILTNITLNQDASVLTSGMNAEKIQYEVRDLKKNVIPLVISFKDAYDGQLNLAILNEEYIILGSSSVRIKQERDSQFTVRFYFEEELDFAQVRYARLTSSM